MTEQHAITIDPGVNGTGVAIFPRQSFDSAANGSTYVPFPVYSRSLSCRDPKGYLQELVQLVQAFNITKAVMEDADYMPNSSKGMAAAATGSLVTLARFIGNVQACMWQLQVEVELYKPSEWKGTLPKEVVKNRILAEWPQAWCTNHDWDAVGIGFWYMGLINKRRK